MSAEKIVPRVRAALKKAADIYKKYEYLLSRDRRRASGLLAGFPVGGL